MKNEKRKTKNETKQALRWLFLVPLIATLSVGCRPASRYPPQAPAKTDQEEKGKPPPPPHDWAWLKPSAAYDVPILFIPDTNPEWTKLPDFWNYYPSRPAAAAVSPIGLDPLGAVVTFALARQIEKVLIKVPRGLPDPTPLIPRANPPTLAKWQLGKKLFFDKILEFSNYNMACATCHDPKTGFTEDRAMNLYCKTNTPTLINCVYNRRQFWDGRVQFLEQTIIRELDDENLAREERPSRHIWGGMVKILRNDAAYKRRFRDVFGIHDPTQDAIAKALATYMRTILSGDSIYDRAEKQRLTQGAAELSAMHFEKVLDDSALKNLEQTKKEDAASALLQGRQLFHGKARCSHCHPGPLFTDHDFHNIGLDEDDIEQLLGRGGRIDRVPVGLKESRLSGAYKTPALRALPRTAPYMHNGKFRTLPEVVDYFDKGIDARWKSFLDPKLLDGPELAKPLDLSADEVRALVLFLRSLDGTPMDPIVAAPK